MHLIKFSIIITIMSTPNRLSRFINIFEERIAPRQLAEAWDNTGLLLEVLPLILSINTTTT